MIEVYDSDGNRRTEENLAIAQSLKGKVLRKVETVLNLKTGRRMQREFCTSPIRDSRGKITGAVGVVRDIAAMERMEKELRQKAIDLELANRELKFFAYAASHDLREPLRKFTTFIDRLRINAADRLDEKSLDFLVRMENAAKRMKQLIDGVLELSQLTTRNITFGKVDLTRVIDDVRSDLGVRIKETGAVIDAGPMPVLEADQLYMRLLFQNLISNAIKFCSTTPDIVIRSRALGDRYQFTIKDNGIGFEERDHERIFEPFQKLHGPGVYDGAGIGLALCQRIVAHHHGAIEAKSAPGKGSVLTVTLPAEQSTT